MESIYNKTISITALIGFIAFTLLALRDGTLNTTPIYGIIAFVAIMFISYFLSSYFLYGQDSSLLILPCFLTQLGLIMLYRINADIFFKQIIWFLIGVIFFILTSLLVKYFIKVPFKTFYFYISTIILLLLPLAIGVERGGSKSWIEIGEFALFQPSELAKITFVLFLASSLKDGKIDNLLKFILEVLSVVGILAITKDLGGAGLFYLTALVMVFVSTSRLDITGGGVLLLGLLGILGYKIFGHVKVRIEAWLNPWKDVPGKGYQIVQSLFAIAEGGFFGTGLGLGHPEYIPAVATDFIFSAFSEEFGFLGAVAIIIVYFLLVYRGIKIALSAQDTFLSLAALGITTMFSIQIFIIIGGVIKLIPLTGVTLPFMSYGGSSMVMSFISLGILNGIRLKEMGDESDE